MTIILETPATRPAVPEKEFNILWLKNFIVHSPSPTATQSTGVEGEDDIRIGRISIEAFPMSIDGELLIDGLIEITTDEFYLMLAEVPEAHAAFTSTLGAVLKMKEWVEARKLMKETINENP